MNSQDGVTRPNIKEDGLMERLRSSGEVGGKARSADVLQDCQVDVLAAGEEEGGHCLVGVHLFSGNKTRVDHNADVCPFCSFIGNFGL